MFITVQTASLPTATINTRQIVDVTPDTSSSGESRVCIKMTNGSVHFVVGSTIEEVQKMIEKACSPKPQQQAKAETKA